MSSGAVDRVQAPPRGRLARILSRLAARIGDRASGSVSARVLLRILPLTLLCYIAVVAVQEYVQYREAQRALIQRLDRISASQSILMSEAVSRDDTGTVRLLVATIVADPDIVGVAVTDRTGAVIDAFGHGHDGEGPLVRRHSINEVTDSGYRKVGELRLAASAKAIQAESRQDLYLHLLTAIVLLVIALALVQWAHRQVIGRPLGRLLAAIRAAEQGIPHRPVPVAAADEIGRLIRAYNVMRPGQEQTEAELRIARDSAEESSRAKSRFLANMSHELRTPLNSIIGYSEVMRDGLLGPVCNARHVEYLDHIHTSGTLLNRLISDILDISRVEAGTIAAQPVANDVDDLFRRCRMFMTPQFEAAGLTLEVQREPDLPPVRCDPDHLLQILLNLLSNAAKFSPPGGAVALRAGRPADGRATSGSGQEIALWVTDTGIGIPPEEQDKVLEPFYQVAQATTRAHKGTGLGLAISRALAGINGGTLQLSSRPGFGTTVSVILPAADDPPGAPETAPGPAGALPKSPLPGPPLSRPPLPGRRPS